MRLRWITTDAQAQGTEVSELISTEQPPRHSMLESLAAKELDAEGEDLSLQRRDLNADVTCRT